MFRQLATRFKNWCGSLQDVLCAGYYTPQTGKLVHHAPSLPRKPKIILALMAGSLAYAAVTDVILNFAEAASVMGVVAGAGVSAVAGAGLLGFAYRRCARAAREEITEVNMAGQTVKGARLDLYRLHEAQKEIISLTAAFQDAASPKAVDAEVRQLVAETSDIRQRVRVIDGAAAPGHRNEYDFVKPVIQLADALPPQPRCHAHRHAHGHHHKRRMG